MLRVVVVTTDRVWDPVRHPMRSSTGWSTTATGSPSRVSRCGSKRRLHYRQRRPKAS